jgi:hypothetical protein
MPGSAAEKRADVINSLVGMVPGHWRVVCTFPTESLPLCSSGTMSPRYLPPELVSGIRFEGHASSKATAGGPWIGACGRSDALLIGGVLTRSGGVATAAVNLEKGGTRVRAILTVGHNDLRGCSSAIAPRSSGSSSCRSPSSTSWDSPTAARAGRPARGRPCGSTTPIPASWGGTFLEELGVQGLQVVSVGTNGAEARRGLRIPTNFTADVVGRTSGDAWEYRCVPRQSGGSGGSAGGDPGGARDAGAQLPICSNRPPASGGEATDRGGPGGAAGA